ncbi:MAG: DUF5916 domain-containing protein [Myxococcota bacterium]
MAVVASAWTLASDVRAQPEPPRRELTAIPRGADPIRVDGTLDEPIWERAPVGTDFVERSPNVRGRPRARTEVRVLYDTEALYVAVVSHLEPGEQPRALERNRDSFRIYSDDAVTVKIDAAFDRRTTVGFGVNPANAQIDYIATDNGRSFRREYDAVWESATTVAADRWIAEFRLPVAAIGLSDSAGVRRIGINVTRDHNFRFATYDFSHLPPELGAVAANRYANLVGVRDMGGGQPLSLTPYVLAGYPDDDLLFDLPFRAQVGGDARLRIGEDVWGELTVLTDFAQVDLDDPVVNLDRFPLFFPERRRFFLTGIDVFEFGPSGSSQLFFSRRIGLDDDGGRVPMVAGLKLYGRVGAVGFGFLDVLTADAATNWTVARLRLNFDGGTYIGGIVTSRYDFEREVALLAYGFDTSLRLLDQRFQVNASMAGSTADPEQPDGEDASSGFLSIRYLGETWTPEASLLYVGPAFDPAVGFVSRRGLVRGRLSVPWTLRPTELPLERFSITPSVRIDANEDVDQRLGGSGELRLALDWPAWGFSASAEFSEDVVEDAFTLLERFDIQPGNYSGATVRYGIYTASERNPNFSLDYSASSEFFGGVIHTVSADVGLALGPTFRTSLVADQSFIRIPAQGSARSLTLGASATLALSSAAVFDLVFQLNDLAELTIAQLRLRWRYLPGSDFFFVFRQEVDFDGDYDAELTVKLSYRFDALL